jgi:hypothetical protein
LKFQNRKENCKVLESPKATNSPASPPGEHRWVAKSIKNLTLKASNKSTDVVARLQRAVLIVPRSRRFSRAILFVIFDDLKI